MYTPLTEEQVQFMKSKNIYDWNLTTDEETYNIGLSLVGSVVCKKSLKPFKSGEIFNTALELVRNPHTMLWAVSFEEDDSCVDIKQLNLKAVQ